MLFIVILSSCASSVQPDAKTYTVTWISDGTILELDEDIAEGSFPSYDGEKPFRQPTNEYIYDFSGWSPYLLSVSGDIEYTAIFTIIERSYEITLDTTGGSNISNLTGYYGDMINEPTTQPIRDGYIFLGWTYDKERSQEVEWPIEISHNFTLYASWQQTEQFKVSYEMNGGLPYEDHEVTKGNYLTIPNQPTKYQYRFINWHSNSELTSPVTFPIIVNSDITLYAEWEIANTEPTEIESYLVEANTINQDFFDKYNRKIEVENDGYQFVDFINPKNKDVFTQGLNSVEVDFLLFYLNQLSEEEIIEIDTLTANLELEIDRQYIQNVLDSLDYELTYENMYKNINLLDFLYEKGYLLEVFLNDNTNDFIFEHEIVGLEYPKYYGVWKDFDEVQTDVIMYALFQQGNNKVIPTIYGDIKAFTHVSTLSSFTYSSYNISLRDLLKVNTPRTKFTLILDRFGKESMVLETLDYDFKPLYLTQDFHWDRNDYNILKIEEKSYGELFLEDVDVRSSWTKQSLFGSYFHQLGSGNSTNSKYLNLTKFYDWTSDSLVTGTNELIFQGMTNSSMLDYESLVTYSYNFGVSAADFAWNFEFSKSLDVTVDLALEHYLRDVYPYLIWGNDEFDYTTHTAFERFVWDKDSADVDAIAHTFLNDDSKYKGKSLSGFDLTNKYLDGTITDGGGEPIPLIIQHTYASSLFDRGDE
jgi:uncharacterized repeat protein (TIGR02543 family)